MSFFNLTQSINISIKIHLRKATVIICTAILLLSCSDNNNQQASVIHQAAAIEKNDECHLCGMLVSNFSGPKAQLFRNGVNDVESNQVRKFCSTRDMFSFYLDPENKRNVTSIFVHDMSKSPWETPNDDYFINAKAAWFVAGSSKTGAMGKTLASFSLAQDASDFANEFGGDVLRFSEIKLSMLI